ncbi:MAG: Biotin-(Acetyl-CoA carboxylase) ligase [Caldanaerobacter subterraneus]|uniref:Bifunctional ligase/repressor BirA n=2 Tax=Caldanaerobacter subterraneus TaxID=911092 RepID=Q8R8N0_CALS4|nr:biotin--[acetyl-CoA-carboxylase] ligase [Caldanaerobacter subterraneus]AAM25144.1 Biotin-(acetyl-CoA carboxylase) ligase [Caldanaerobacter subterraneus subsp. tengcongensis MB4]KUK09425.1 MAG: Biotin-(Acetyl-CoA carboxylase) ligase [Caldanaerobacter subterraneus]MCS3915264.1 BirA family biotin operon repressor/biotin-[acetyl-CoA-carboxylase] ligase [Caldanaerobacter subterraneus subsp. tengcongensis MB4]HBT49682.1 biotin--[acetyl-CoA-carboxylase] ligase [Caldanaerobacter subterraneus]
MLRQKLVEILKKNREGFISGQKLSEIMKVSRTAIWKQIKELEKLGYKIQAHRKLGYRLISEPDLLIYEEIAPYLNTKFIGRNYIHKESLSSTNDMAKELAYKVPDGTVIVAEEQTKGRGRMGRSWFSEKSSCILTSVILKPQIRPEKTVALTQVAALTVVKAIEEVCSVKTKIKWPNDIILNSKKVCGILTEMSSEIDVVNYIVIGIGINVNCTEFPDDLKEKATSLQLELEKPVDRKKLLASLLNNLEIYYKEYEEKGFESLRPLILENSITIGKEVRVIYTDREIRGQAIAIDKEGKLVIKTEKGEEIALLSGEVSVRGLLDYI